MYKGQYSGLHNGLGRGQQYGLLKGQLRGTVANNKGTPQKFTVIWMGDSNANGTASQRTPCATNTFFNFNGANFEEITTQSVNNKNPGDGNYGSIHQPFANEYKLAFNKPVYSINCAKGGTYYCNDVAANSWGSSGDLRGLALAKVSKGLNAIGKKSPDLIVVNKGINDARNVYGAGTIATAIDDFYLWVTTQYPGVPVLAIQQGRSEVSINGSLYYVVRKGIMDAAITYANVHVVALAAPFAFITGDMETDLLHYAAPAQRKLGKQLVQWILNARFSKWGRSMLSWRYSIPTNKQKIEFDNWVQSQVTSVNLFRFEGLFLWKIAGVKDDCLIDYSGMGYGAFGDVPTFTEGSHLTFDGVNDYFATGILGDQYDSRGADVNNVTVGCRVKANRSSGTLALFGATDAGGSTSLIQNAVRARVDDATLLTGTDTTFQANTTYTARRENGTTRRILKDKTSNASAAVANTGQIDTYSQVVAAIQSSGGITSFLDCDLEYYFYAGYSNFDYDNFYDNTKTMLDNWTA